jgi:hypothetical protein
MRLNQLFEDSDEPTRESEAVKRKLVAAGVPNWVFSTVHDVDDKVRWGARFDDFPEEGENKKVDELMKTIKFDVSDKGFTLIDFK